MRKSADHTTSRPLDSHERWAEFRGQKERATANLADDLEALVEKGLKVSGYEASIIESASTQMGHEPGSGLAMLKKILEHQSIQWQQLLRKFVGRGLQRKVSYRWPSRRLPHLLGIVPGVRRSASKPRVMCVIDTSGSMSDNVLAALSTELLRLSGSHETWVVECDAEIHAAYRMVGPLSTLRGRGGTSFKPPFEAEFLKKMKPELIIYLTDGYGLAPERPPRVPVLWLLTTDTTPPAPWGTVGRILSDRIGVFG